MIIILEFPNGKTVNREVQKNVTDHTSSHVSEENRHLLQAQLVLECCSMRNLD